MKNLGFGLMRLPLTDPRDEKTIDLEETKRMADAFLEAGFTYFDTAWPYHRKTSENAVKTVLTERYPREAFRVATKLHPAFIKTKEDRDRIFEAQLEKTGLTYFDCYLLHDLNIQYYDKMKELDCFSWIREKKALGKAKRIGFSFHDEAELLDRILTEQPGFDFVQLQINYLDWESEGIQSRRCYETARKHGLSVIVMEPVKGGTLSSLPEKAEDLLESLRPEWSMSQWALAFAADLPGVEMVLSGMHDLRQIRENTALFDGFPGLTEREREALVQAADILNHTVVIPCTGCAYCTDGCPMRIPIPRYFSLYNADMQEIEDKPFTSQVEYYANYAQVFGKASDCIECGQCQRICPQHIPIIDKLKDVAAYFER